MRLPLALLLTLLIPIPAYSAQEEECLPVEKPKIVLERCHCDNILDFLRVPEDDPGFTQNGDTFRALAFTRFSTGSCTRLYNPVYLLSELDEIEEILKVYDNDYVK